MKLRLTGSSADVTGVEFDDAIHIVRLQFGYRHLFYT